MFVEREGEREREREREFSVAFVEYGHIKCMYLREREMRLLPALAFTSASALNGTLTSFTMTLSESPHCFPSLLLLVPISFLFKMAASKLIDL